MSIFRKSSVMIGMVMFLALSVGLQAPAANALEIPLPGVERTVRKGAPIVIAAAEKIAAGGVTSNNLATVSAGLFSMQTVKGILGSQGKAAMFAGCEDLCQDGVDYLSDPYDIKFNLGLVVGGWNARVSSTFGVTNAVDKATAPAGVRYDDRMVFLPIGTNVYGEPSPRLNPQSDQLLLFGYQWNGAIPSDSNVQWFNAWVTAKCQYRDATVIQAPPVPLHQYMYAGEPWNQFRLNLSPDLPDANGIHHNDGNVCPSVSPSGSQFWNVVGLKTSDRAFDDAGNPMVHPGGDFPFPVNNISWQTETKPVPLDQMKIKVTQNCVGSNGVVSPLVSMAKGTDSTLTIPSCIAAGKGNHSTGTTISSPNANGDDVPLFQAKPKVIDGAPASCSAPVAGATPCTLEVWVDGKNCVEGALCSDWARINQQHPERVQCKYGGAVVAVAECNSLELAFVTGAAPQFNDLNTDGNPDTGGVDYKVDLSKPRDQAGNQVKADPTTGTNPGTGSSPGGFPTEGQQPGDDCMSSFWTFNPVGWTYLPVKCALQAAFVPDPVFLQEQFTQVENSFQSKGIKPAVDVMQGNVAAIAAAAGGSGCKGPPLPFKADFSTPWSPNMKVDQIYYPLDACTDPLKGIASFTNIVIGFLSVVAGGFAIVRTLGRAFGFEFGMKVDANGN